MTRIDPAPTVTLANGVEMPQLGLGTWPMTDDEAAKAVATAIETGYRLIDTAENYKNETGVGQGIRDAGVARDEVFLTTKMNKQWHSVDGARRACEASLERLGLDYIDLFLIHWPNPDQGTYVEAFEGLTRLLDAGLVRAIGTSNFLPHHLNDLFAAGFVPHVNQIQLDPYHLRPDITAIHAAKGIVTESWSPIGRAGEMLADPAITRIAEAHGKTPAQIVLRWQVQSGFVPAPKSADPERQAQNLDVFGFALTESDMAALNGLDRPDPDMLDANSFGH
ncbi:2,5-diketo-D-gluconate reductase A [Maritimibacter alkaliphilus HTCC2654]|uniref:Oxidoreductase n=1 Tax=Maritimibacter alkaliphilus HTCC2654 TaxID=314271 RepID=A3VHZ9_9RHOB|nr:aldo/keto reductase [Maritimibacter alkaliphilus]EAQ11998.1 oxidoreductase [Rhodobacterales bacterium HTCC2654] [Maritimibacter alkaliphilus HTCC2654]TYP83052.1 2,5-diketo-D-gluconate reductase A [Maritimibacter alkaliphilus HTCC2654]